MFKKYVEELSKETNQVEEEINMYESLLKEKKEINLYFQIHLKLIV